MTIGNPWEGSNEQDEVNNKQQTISKKFEDLRWEWQINDFIDAQSTYNLSEINDEFLDEKTKKFFSENSSKKEEFDKLEPEEQKKLKETFSKSLERVYISKKEIVSDLKKTFSNNYDLSEEQISKLEESLKWLKLQDSRQRSEKETDKTKIDLKELSMFKSFQEDFLVELWFFKDRSEIVLKKDSDFEIWNIFGTDKIEFKSKTDKLKVLTLIRDWKSTSRIEIDDLKAALKYIPAENKAKIFEYFISKISLEDLKLVWFLTDEKANEIKENLIKKYKDNWENINIKKEDLDESLIFIDDNFIVNELVSSEKIESLLVREVAKEMNQLKKDTINHINENSILSKLKPEWNENNINNSFIDYIKKNPLQGVSNIENLQNWNFIVLETKKPDWTIHRMVQKIEKVDDWSTLDWKSIKLSNYTSFYGVLKTPSKTDNFLYTNFYEFLQTPKYASWAWEETKIDFLTEEEYNYYLEGKTKQEDWEYKVTEKPILKVEKDEWAVDLAELKAKIDIIDPNWKAYDITTKWKTTFSVWNPWDKDYWCYSIKEIDWGKITLSSKDYKTWIFETLDFGDFLKAFEKKEAKRWAFIWVREPFMLEFFKMKAFEGRFEFKDGKLIEKAEKWEKARNLEYLVNSKWEAIKIEEFWHDFVNVCIWDLKEEKAKDWKSTKRTFSHGWITRMSYEDFYAYINNVKKDDEKGSWQAFFPNEKEQKPTDVKEADRKFSVGKALMSFYCMADITAGLKMLPNLIEDYLKQWSSIRSAKFALALGKNLPDDVRLQLQSKVESEQKKTVEWLVDKRIFLDSTEFVPIIDKVITNSASEDYEVEAALMAILKKYWKLYRWDLAKHSWTFIWYKALWGKPNDALFNDVRKEYEKRGKPFTEEALIEELLKIQSTPVYIDGKLNPKWRAKYGITRKRRSKFGKDFGWYVKAWIKDELEDGKAKTEWMLSVDSVIGYALWEFSKLAHNNWIWAMDVVWDKWWTAAQMNMLPHIITSTGLSQSLWDSTLTSLWKKSLNKPYPALHFCKTKEDVKTYRNVCGALVNRMNISEGDKKLFYSSINDNLKEQDRIKAATEFYSKHWEELNKKLTINQDPIIFLEKDKNPDFKRYYDMLKDLYFEMKSEYSIEKGSVEAGTYNFDHSLPFFTGWFGFMFKSYSINTEKWSPANPETKVWNSEIEKIFKWISKMDLDVADKKKIFEYTFKNVEILISGALWGAKNLERAKRWEYPFIQKLKKSVFLELSYDNRDDWYQDTDSFKNLMEGQWEKYKAKFIDNAVPEEREKSQFEQVKEARETFNNKELDVLRWRLKASDLKWEETIKWEEAIKNKVWSIIESDELELDEEELEEKQEECLNILEKLKRTDNKDSEQANIVEKISKDWLWKKTKKDKDKNSDNFVHPFYWKMKILLVDWELDYNTFRIDLPKWYGIIKNANGKITYKK